MSLFRKQESRKVEKNIYTIKYNSFFEMFRYPNPADFFFSFLIIFIFIDTRDISSIFPLIGILIFIDGFFWFSSKGNKIILSDVGFHSNMWTKISIPFYDMEECYMKDSSTLVIKSKLIGNYYLHDLQQFEFDRIKIIIEENARLLPILHNDEKIPISKYENL